MDLGPFLIQILNATQYGLLLFLIASGLTLIFGVMGVINLAHGSFYMMGAYLAFTLTSLTGNLFLAIVAGTILSALLGTFLEWALFSHLYKRDHLQQVLLTYGLILIFEELRSMMVGDEVHGVNVPQWLDFSIPLGDTMTYPVYRLFMSAVCIVVAIGLYFLIQRTRVGSMIRAGASNRDMVQILGINIKMVNCLVFSLGGRAGCLRRHDQCAAIGRVAGHGHAGAHHQFRGGGHRRHRLGLGRAVRVAADRLRRHLRQDPVCRVCRHGHLYRDGNRIAVAS